nr:hypothetical protein [Tanacetum cinerariifolium]
MEQFQVNTKFLNSLPPEWSKFMTDVKLVKDLHTSNFDQLHAYLEQHELYENEVRIMRERNQDQLAFIANPQMTPPHFNTYQSSYNNPQLQQQFSPSQHGSIKPNQHYSSHHPSQTQFNHSSIPPSNTFQSQMNHQTSTVPQEKVLLAEAQEARQILDEEKLTFLANLKIPADQAQIIIPHNVAFQTEDLDTYDSNYDDLSTTQAILMANISNYGSDVISEVPNSETYLNDMDNQNVPSKLPKVSLVNASLKKLKFHLTQFDSVVKKRTTPNDLEEGIFNVFDKDLLNKIMKVQTVLDQMEAAIQQFSLDKKCLQIAKEEILLENDRLLQKIMSLDVLLTVMNSMSLNNDSVNMEIQKCKSCEKCLDLNAEFSKSKQANLSKNESCICQNAPEIPINFEKNDLKAQLQDKDTTICKLKDTIKSLRKNNKEEIVDHDRCDLATINEELENHVKENQENDKIESNTAKQPLDNALDFACKHAKRIHELLVYVRDTCPSAVKLSETKVKENQEKDKIESNTNKSEKRGEAGKSQKQLQ